MHYYMLPMLPVHLFSNCFVDCVAGMAAPTTCGVFTTASSVIVAITTFGWQSRRADATCRPRTRGTEKSLYI